MNAAREIAPMWRTAVGVRFVTSFFFLFLFLFLISFAPENRRWGLLVGEKFFDSFESFSTDHSKWSCVRIGLFFANNMTRTPDFRRGAAVRKLKLTALL